MDWVLLAIFAILFSLNNISVLIPLIIIIILIAAAGASMRGASILGAFGIASIAGVRLGKGGGPRPTATSALKRHRLFLDAGFFQKAVYVRLDKAAAMAQFATLTNKIKNVQKQLALARANGKRNTALEKELQNLLTEVMSMNLKGMSVNPKLASLANLNPSGRKGKAGSIASRIGPKTLMHKFRRAITRDKSVEFKDAQAAMLHQIRGLISQYAAALKTDPKDPNKSPEFQAFLKASQNKMQGYLNGTPTPEAAGGITIASFFMRERNLAANRKKYQEYLMKQQKGFYATEKKAGGDVQASLSKSQENRSARFAKTKSFFGSSNIEQSASLGLTAARGKLSALNLKGNKKAAENAAVLADKKYEPDRSKIINDVRKNSKYTNVLNADGTLNFKDKNTKDFLKDVRKAEASLAKKEISTVAADLKADPKIASSAKLIKDKLTAEFTKANKPTDNYIFNKELDKRLKKELGFNPSDSKQAETFAKALLINQVDNLEQMKDKIRDGLRNEARGQIASDLQKEIVKEIKNDVNKNYSGTKDEKDAEVGRRLKESLSSDEYKMALAGRISTQLDDTASKIGKLDINNNEQLTSKAAELLGPRSGILGNAPKASSETEKIVNNLRQQVAYEKFSDITMSTAVKKREEFLDKQGTQEKMKAVNEDFRSYISNTTQDANEEKNRTLKLLESLRSFDEKVMKAQPRMAQIYSGKEYYFEDKINMVNPPSPTSTTYMLNPQQKEAQEKVKILREGTTGQSKASILGIPGNQGPTPSPAQPPTQQKPQQPKSEPTTSKPGPTPKTPTPSPTLPKSEQQEEQIQPKPQRPQPMPEQTLKTLESKVEDELLSMHVNAYATSNESNSDAVQNLAGRIDSAMSATGLKSNKDVSTKIAQDLLTQAKSRELNDKDVAEAIARSQASVPTPPRQESVPPQPEVEAPKPTIPPREEIKVPSGIRGTATETAEQEVQRPKQEVLQEIQSSVTNFKPTEDEGSQALLAATIKQKLESVGMAASQEELNKAAADILPIITSRSKKKKAKIEQTLSNWLDELMEKPQ